MSQYELNIKTLRFPMSAVSGILFLMIKFLIATRDKILYRHVSRLERNSSEGGMTVRWASPETRVGVRTASCEETRTTP